MMHKTRSIPMAILLSLITCGIYSIYWFIVLSNEVNEASETGGTSGGTAMLFSIITCGVYYFYWNYSMGSKLDEMRHKADRAAGNFSILFLVLSLFGLSIVNYAIIQNELNACAVEF